MNKLLQNILDVMLNAFKLRNCCVFVAGFIQKHWKEEKAKMGAIYSYDHETFWSGKCFRSIITDSDEG
jgi:hypothetical protein